MSTTCGPPTLWFATIPHSTKEIFFKLGVDYVRRWSSTPTTRGLMRRYQGPMYLYGPIGGTTIVPGLQPSTAPIVCLRGGATGPQSACGSCSAWLCFDLDAPAR